MKMNIKKTLAVTALALTGGLFAVNSHAALVGLVGSSTIGTIGATISGTDLSNSGQITIGTSSPSPYYGTNAGDFSPIPAFSQFFLGGQPFLLNAATNSAAFGFGAQVPTNVSSWNITGPAGTYGTYAVSTVTIISDTANFLNVFTSGMFTPGSVEGTQAGGCQTGGNTCDVTNATLRWSFTQSGSSVSASGTFNAPGVPLEQAPEPVTISMLGLGLAGWAASRRKAA